MRDPVLGGTINPVREPPETLGAPPRPRVPGWVWLFAAGQVLGVAYRVHALAHTAGILWDIRHSAGAAAVAVRGFASTRMLLEAMLVSLGATGAVKIARRRPHTRRYWLLVLPMMLAIVATVSGLNASERGVLAVDLGHPVASDFSLALAIWNCVAMSLWWLYWNRSKRVREAFEPPARPDGAQNAGPVETLATTGV